MSSPTEEQKLAINEIGKNIIVSAGAGSGKTYVLKERVLKELKEKKSIDKFVILTFTNAAAAEMKVRIRKIIMKNKEVHNQLPLIDSAYITTFDSYAQSIVKKYNYLLNISKNFSIIDKTIVDIELTRLIDEILERNYQNPSDDFKVFINNYCFKNDKGLKKYIIDLYHDLCKFDDKKEFLNTYMDKYYSDEYIKAILKDYNEIYLTLKTTLLEELQELIDHTLDSNASAKNTIAYNTVESARNWEEFNDALNSIKLASANEGVYDEDFIPLKNHISDIISAIKKKRYETDTIARDNYYKTQSSLKVLIDILLELDERITEFKDAHNGYEFHDIANKAIELVAKHEDIRKEIRDEIDEIMIDEYQDTNDIQEKFINYINNDNVFMVGDIKQSIYRFRNANPYIFKSKYDKYVKSEDYKDGNPGVRIDLTSNFRSRKEVIDNINEFFSKIMTNNIGGANYKDDHIMTAKNEDYNSLLIDKYDFNMELLNYEYDGNQPQKDEIEAFIMAKDIKKKIKENKKAVHEVDDKLEFEDISWKHFAVLIDKSKNFDLIKKVFEYEGIPCTIEQDISIKEDDELFILKNLVNLIIHVYEDNLDADFIHSYLSVGRSYVYRMTDNELFDIYNNNSYKETDLYHKAYEISKVINSLSNKEILVRIIDDFDITNKVIEVGDIQNRTYKLEYFVKRFEELNDFGMDIYSLNDYFNQILDSKDDITVNIKDEDSDAVRIMTIHHSKGLEFNYVYLPYLNSDFIFDAPNINRKYGIISQYVENDLVKKPVTSLLIGHNERKEIISEKIRLLYVAITRAKEKFILINSYNKKEPVDVLTEDNLLECTNYTDIITLLKGYFDKYRRDINLNDLGISNAYKSTKSFNYKEAINKNNTIIDVKPIEYDSVLLDNKHFSKPMTSLMTQQLRDTLDMGTYMHYVFEITNFNPLNVDTIAVSDEVKEKVKNFLNEEPGKNIINAKRVFKEHEIRFTKDDSLYHGFIDLLVEYDDHFDIIDYKLSNTSSEEYVKQLNGYKDYVEEKYHKKTNIYLYSINKGKFFPIN